MDEFNASKPIYLQLADRIHRQIISGELKAGEKLPSIRDMGIKYSMNPNTVQRAYSELSVKGSWKRSEVNLAREVPYILMDEPLSGLDPMVRESIVKGMISYVDLNSQTLIMTSHEVAEIEL